MVLSKIKDTILRYNLVKSGESVLVGLSGGADSICLIHALHTLREELGINVYAAHVNHGIRGAEAKKDERFAKVFAEGLGIQCFAMECDVPTLAAEKGISEETAGRIVRYDFFETLCEKYSIDKIATAHNKNDNAETVLMNFMRGSGIGGLCGIPYMRGKVIRPLLNVDRSSIEDYCRTNRLDFVTDSTNHTLDYTRNKIRHILIPSIEKDFNPNFINTLSENTVLVRNDSAYIEKQANKAYEELVNNNCIKTEKLINVDIAIGTRIVRRMIMNVKKDADNVSSVNINDVMKLIHKESGSYICLPDGIIARIEYENLIIEKEIEGSKDFCYVFKCGMTGIIPEITSKITICNATERIKDGAVYLSCPDDAEITVRSRREGDVFSPCGMTGSKKVKQYFIDNKIPAGKRSSIPIIEINGKIAAVGERVDRNFLFRDGGIRIKIHSLEVKD